MYKTGKNRQVNLGEFKFILCAEAFKEFEITMLQNCSPINN